MFSLRLWHQLTLKLMEFVKNEYFAQNGGLVEVWQYSYAFTLYMYVQYM